MKTTMLQPHSPDGDLSERKGTERYPMPLGLAWLWQKIVREAAILSICAIVPALTLFSYSQRATRSPAVTKDVQEFSQDTLWIDARSEAEFEKDHIPGALSLNEKNWKDALPHLFETWQPPRPIVVYCSAGCPASTKVAAKLTELGIEPVRVLEGGFEEWKRSNG